MTQHRNPAVNRLLVRKAYLEERISEEMQRPVPDALKLQHLKRLTEDLVESHRFSPRVNGP